MRAMIRPYAGGIYAARGIGPCAKGMTPERLRKGSGELRMPLGQRIAHMAPKRCRRFRDPLCERQVHALEQAKGTSPATPRPGS